MSKGAEQRRPVHDFRLDHRGEFDEVCVENATVHIERMDETDYWIGIYAPGKPSLTLATGVHKGIWYFNLNEDVQNGKCFQVQRPRNSKPVRPENKSSERGPHEQKG